MNHINNILKHLKEPYVILLIGPPLCGKSTWIRTNFSEDEVVVIGMDKIIVDQFGGDKDYNAAWRSVNQKALKAEFHKQLIDASKNDKNVIIDMTHLVSKRRKHNLSYFPNHYYKLGVLFSPISEEEYEKRNKIRTSEENKNITPEVYKMMLGQYQPIRKDEEGFDKVVSL
jgi:predicted kinase